MDISLDLYASEGKKNKNKENFNSIIKFGLSYRLWQDIMVIGYMLIRGAIDLIFLYDLCCVSKHTNHISD